MKLAKSCVARIEILEAFVELPDVRKVSGKGHQMALCLALFTLAVTAGNRGFLAIGDWLKSYRSELIALFNPPKQRLPSCSTIRRVLLNLDYSDYSAALTRYYIASFLESADSFAQRIRGYWGVENKVHHVRDVTQGEDASRIRMHQLSS